MSKAMRLKDQIKNISLKNHVSAQAVSPQLSVVRWPIVESSEA